MPLLTPYKTHTTKQYTETTPVEVVKYWERHLRLWVIYPIDVEGNQTQACEYANPSEVDSAVKDLERELGIV